MTEMLERNDDQSPLLDAINELNSREEFLSKERSLPRLVETQVSLGSVHEIVDLRRGKIATIMTATPDDTLHKPLVSEVVEISQPSRPSSQAQYRYGRY